MAPLPPSIRVNLQAPFPALVQGSGPVVIGKQAGIWTVQLSFAGLGVQTPPPANYATDYILVYDSVAQTFFKAPLTGSLFGRARTQRSVTATPIVVASTDEILNCNITAAAACALPAAATRNGLALTFKDLGQAAAHNITLTPNGVETIDGAANAVLKNNYQSMTLVPFNDGVNSGWMIQ
jgi:hypothetical protein